MDRRALTIAATEGRTGLLTANLADRMLGNFDDKWIDVGFWVRADGRVEELEIVRRSADASWADPLLASIRGRRYAAGDAATYRLERYTYTSGFQHNDTGTHISGRSSRARVEYFDLSEGAAPPPAAPAAPAPRSNNIN